MSQIVLDWVEEALRAERQSLFLVLHERHQHMMKALAQELKGVRWTNSVPPITTLDPFGPSGDYPLDVDHLTVNLTPLMPKPFQDRHTRAGLKGLPQFPVVGDLGCALDADHVTANKVETTHANPKCPQPAPAIGDLGWASDADHVVANKSEGVHGEPDDQHQDTHHIVAKTGKGANGKPSHEHKVHGSCEWMRHLLSSPKFETFIGGVILVNSALMGVEAQFETEGRDLTIFHAFEHFFLACYTLEVCMWFFAYGFSIVCRNGWVAFDCVLVVFGILGNYIVGPLVENLKDSSDETLKNTLAGLLVMRMLRLFRLARILRVLVVFKVLWMLIRGLLGSASTIAYTMGLIMVIVYMYSCMSIELITKKHRHTEDARIAALVASHFSDLPVTILSLLQFVSVDGIAALYFPLVKADPVLIVFFLPLILIVSVALMNLVTAVIVEGAIEQGKQDREAMARYRQYAFKKLQPHLKDLFNQMDQDGNSRLTRDELLCAPEEIKLELEQYMHTGSESLMELFEMIDVDESGEVDIDEFCDGVGKLVYSEAPVELIRVLKQLKIIRKHLDALQSPKLKLIVQHPT